MKPVCEDGVDNFPRTTDSRALCVFAYMVQEIYNCMPLGVFASEEPPMLSIFIRQLMRDFEDVGVVMYKGVFGIVIW
jgi:hypothetical protein